MVRPFVFSSFGCRMMYALYALQCAPSIAHIHCVFVCIFVCLFTYIYIYIYIYIFLLEKKMLLQMAYWFFLGRAGRFGSKFPDGEVTCMDVNDLPLLHSSLKSPSPVLEVIAQSK